MSDLAFFTAQELIDELMRRQTFCGVVVHAADDHRRDQWPEERWFKVQFNGNLESDQTGRLLQVVADHINFQPE